MEKALNDRDRVIQSVDFENEDLRQRLFGLREELLVQQSMHEETKKLVEISLAENERLRGELGKAQEEVEARDSRIAALQRESQGYISEIRTREARCNIHEAQIKELDDNVKTLRKKCFYNSSEIRTLLPPFFKGTMINL